MEGTNPALLAIGGDFQGRYKIVRCIKAGGMGAVYEVQHIETRRRRALKVMLPSAIANADLRGRFRREATIAADIESEHIAEVLDAGVDPDTGAPFIVMELLKGDELGALLARCGKLSADDVVEYLRQAGSALDKTHAAGIVHRDLKPENMFITYRDDGTPRLKLLDFGIAKVREGDEHAQETKGILGTPLYISPEQVHGDHEVTGRTDVFALGHIAFTLLTGEPYWVEERDNNPTVYKLLICMLQGSSEAASVRAKRRSGVDLPPAFDAWFARATAQVPADRFPDVATLVKALASALGVDMHVSTVARTRAPEREATAASDPAPATATPSAAAGQDVSTRELLAARDKAPPAPTASAADGDAGKAATEEKPAAQRTSEPDASAASVRGNGVEGTLASSADTHAEAARPARPPMLWVAVGAAAVGLVVVVILATRGPSAAGTPSAGATTAQRSGPAAAPSASVPTHAPTASAAHTSATAEASATAETSATADPSEVTIEEYDRQIDVLVGKIDHLEKFPDDTDFGSIEDLKDELAILKAKRKRLKEREAE